MLTPEEHDDASWQLAKAIAKYYGHNPDRGINEKFADFAHLFMLCLEESMKLPKEVRIKLASGH